MTNRQLELWKDHRRLKEQESSSLQKAKLRERPCSRVRLLWELENDFLEET